MQFAQLKAMRKILWMSFAVGACLNCAAAFCQDSTSNSTVTTHTLPSYGSFVIQPSIEYTMTSSQRISVSGFTLFQAILIGKVQASRLDQKLVIPAITFRWRLKQLQLWAQVPWLYRADQEVVPVKDHEEEISLDSNHIGDVEMGVYYPFFKQTLTLPGIALTMRFKTRTGRSPYGLPTKVFNTNLPPQQTEFPTGNGHYGVALGLNFVKTTDPAVLFFNMDYFYNIPRDIGVKGGTNYGNIDPGNSFEFSFGEVFALNEYLSTSLYYDERLTGVTTQNGNTVVGSDVTVATFNFTVTYATGRRSISLNTALGLTRDASDVDLLLRVPFGL